MIIIIMMIITQAVRGLAPVFAVTAFHARKPEVPEELAGGRLSLCQLGSVLILLSKVIARSMHARTQGPILLLRVKKKQQQEES